MDASDPAGELQEVFVHDEEDEKAAVAYAPSSTPHWRCFKPGGFVGPLTPTPEPLMTPSGVRFVADLPLRKNGLLNIFFTCFYVLTIFKSPQ